MTDFAFRRFIKKLTRRATSKNIYPGFSSMAPVFIPVDSDCYPLYRGILYNDIRAKREIEELERSTGEWF
ncbi:MAG: hypothetical protein ACP5GH_05560 [Nitrososphaeria archaeon]